MRAILVAIFDKDLKIIHGPMPNEGAAEIRAFRKQVFDLYLPVTSGTRQERKRHAKRRFVLEYFLNGNIMSEQRIEHFCARGSCASEAQTREHLAHYVSWSLIPTKLPVLSRKSWTGFASTLSWIGLLHAHHGLFQRVMEVYLGGPTAAPPAEAQSVRRPQAGSAAWARAFEDDAGGGGSAAVPNGADPEGEDAQDDAADQFQREELGEVDWAAFKRQQRVGAKQW